MQNWNKKPPTWIHARKSHLQRSDCQRDRAASQWMSSEHALKDEAVARRVPVAVRIRSPAPVRACQVFSQDIVSRWGPDAATPPCARRGPRPGTPRQHLPIHGKGLAVPGTGVVSKGRESRLHVGWPGGPV